MVSLFGAREVISQLPVPAPLSKDASLFIDFDGTLANTASSPRDVFSAVYLPDLLLRVRSNLGGAIAILSDRTVQDVDRLTKWTVPAVAGVHGLERRTASNSPLVTGSGREFVLDGVRRELQLLLELHPRILVEDKGVAISLHYERCPEAQEDCVAFARYFVLAEAVSGIWETSLIEGAWSIELALRDSTKAIAVREFMTEAPFRGRRPIAIGCDPSAEDVFREVQRLGGIAIIVGDRRPTVANYALADPRSVHEWLTAMS